MDYLVPEQQSYHLDMGSVSGAGEVDAAGHFRELYGGRGQASFPARPFSPIVIHRMALLVHLVHEGLLVRKCLPLPPTCSLLSREPVQQGVVSPPRSFAQHSGGAR